MAEAAKRVPHGVVRLLSALVVHGLTTQTPHQVWLAIEPQARKPTFDYPPLKIVRFSGAAFSEGVEGRFIDGVPVNVTGVEKTIADCFKYRNKLTVAVAVEALHEPV